MRRRSKLVYLLSFNAILASALVALGVLLLSESSSPDLAHACANDEPDTGQLFMPVNDSFDSIAEAEQFICHSVAYPRLTDGWLVENISASRSGPARAVGAGAGFASVTFDYMQPNNPRADFRIEVSPFNIDPVTYGIIGHVPIMDSQASLIQGLDDRHYIMQWQADGFSFYVEANLAEGFGLPDLYAILNSIR